MLGTDLLHGCWEIDSMPKMEKAAVRATSKDNIYCFLTLSNLSGFKLEADRKAEGPFEQVGTSAAATWFHIVYRELLPTEVVSCATRAELKHSEN